MAGREVHVKDFDEKRLSATMAGKTSKDGAHSFQSGEAMYNLNPDLTGLAANAIITLIYPKCRSGQGIHLIKASKDSAKAKEFKNDKPSDPVIDMEFDDEKDQEMVMKAAYGYYALMRKAGANNSTVMSKWDPRSGITADQYLGTKIKRTWYQPVDPLGNPISGTKPRVSAKVTQFTQFMDADNKPIAKESLAGLGFTGVARVKPHHITFVNEISLIVYLASFTITDVFEAEVQGIPVSLNAEISAKDPESSKRVSSSMAAIMEARKNKGVDTLGAESKALVLVGAAGPSQTQRSGTLMAPAGVTGPGPSNLMSTASQVAAAIQAVSGQSSAVGADGLMGAPSIAGAGSAYQPGQSYQAGSQFPPQYTATGSTGYMGGQAPGSFQGTGQAMTPYQAPPQYTTFQGGTLPMTVQPAFGSQPQVIHNAGMPSFAAAMGQQS